MSYRPVDVRHLVSPSSLTILTSFASLLDIQASVAEASLVEGEYGYTTLSQLRMEVGVASDMLCESVQEYNDSFCRGG